MGMWKHTISETKKPTDRGVLLERTLKFRDILD